MILTGVPSTHVDQLWPYIVPLILRGLAESDGRYKPDDILVDLLTGDKQLWIEGDDRVTAICITNIITGPRRKRLTLFLCAGDGVIQRLPETLPVIEAWAKEQGCDQAEIVGRREWVRVLADSGYLEGATILRKDLPHE